MPEDDAVAVWDKVFDVGQRFGIHPVGIRAMDVARVEAGLILIEAEYTSARHAVAPEQQYSPFELNFDGLVDFNKASDFNGRRALLAERKAGGPERRLVGLHLDWAGIEGMYAKHGLASAISPYVHRDPIPVYKEGRQVGRTTSTTWGPTIKKMICVRLASTRATAAWARGSASSGASRASEARSARPSSRCRSSTPSASAASPGGTSTTRRRA